MGNAIGDPEENPDRDRTEAWPISRSGAKERADRPKTTGQTRKTESRIGADCHSRALPPNCSHISPVLALFCTSGSRTTAAGNRLLGYDTTQTVEGGKAAAHNAIFSARIGPPARPTGGFRLW